MELFDADRAAERVDRLVHFDTQAAPTGLDLTVGAVLRLGKGGALDFGGSEFRAADAEEVDAELKHPDDEYGWWTLSEGLYLLEYNEGFAPENDEFGVVRPLERLHAAGATHGSFDLDGPTDPIRTLVEVGRPGIELKENFRASRLQVYRFG